MNPKPLACLDSTYEPSPEPQTLKERLIHPSEFSIEFEDYGNTSKYAGHGKLTRPSEEVSSKVEPSKEWLMEVKRSFKAIQILLPSTTMSCSLRGTFIEALQTPRSGLVSCQNSKFDCVQTIASVWSLN